MVNEIVIEEKARINSTEGDAAEMPHYSHDDVDYSHSSDGRRTSPRQKAESGRDTFFSVEAKEHLREAQAFRRTGYNSQSLRVNPDPAADIDGVNRSQVLRNNTATVKEAMGISPSDEIYHNYAAIKEAYLILYKTRQEAEQFLRSKRGAVSYSVGVAVVREVVASLAGVCGAFVGSVVPVVGTFAGGLVAKESAKKLLIPYSPVPNTAMAKKIDAASHSTGKKIITVISDTLDRKKLTEKSIDKYLNSGLESITSTSLPVSIPFVGMFNGVKELIRTNQTTKEDFIRELILGIDEADALIEKLDRSVRAAFKTSGREFNYHVRVLPGLPSLMSRATREFGVRVNGSPIKTWVRSSRYEHYYAEAKSELANLKALVNTRSQDFKYETLGRTTAV